MSKKQMLWIGLGIVAVISLLIGGEIISKQKAEQKQQENIQTALNLSVDNINESWKNTDNSILLKPRNIENIDSTVFEKVSPNSKANSQYVVKLRVPIAEPVITSEYRDTQKDKTDNYLLRTVKYSDESKYYLIDLSSTKKSVMPLTEDENGNYVVENDDIQAGSDIVQAGQKLSENKNFKEDRNTKANLDELTVFKDYTADKKDNFIVFDDKDELDKVHAKSQKDTDKKALEEAKQMTTLDLFKD